MRRVASENEKQRFALREEPGELLIRANQGHSMEVGVVGGCGLVQCPGSR